MIVFCGSLVALFGLCLIGEAVVIFVRPKTAERFLMLFGSSAKAHWLEQSVRLVVGIAVLAYAPGMWMPFVFTAFGWVVLVTSVVLLVLPWQLHNRFARWAMPPVLRHARLFGLAAAALGMLLIAGALVPLCQ